MAVLYWKGTEAIEQVKRAGAIGVRLGAEHLLAKANETVPYLDGILEQSGTVDAEELTAVVSYGGAASGYAVVQHERVEFHHPGKGRAKWLELTCNEQRFQAAKVVHATIRRVLNW
jgi:hypothetical protein